MTRVAYVETAHPQPIRRAVPTLLTSTGIGYDRSGPASAIPLVLIHAGIADRRMWDHAYAALAASRDVVRIDLRGFGESSAPPVAGLTHLGDVARTLDELHITLCHVVGASLGAGVAVELALTWSGRVASLMLCPPGGSLLAELTPDLEALIASEQAALALGDLDAAVEAIIRTWVVGQGRPATAVDPAVLDAVRAMQRRAFEIPRAWGAEIEHVEVEPPALERLPDVSAPVLVLIGAHDLDTTRDAATRVCAAAPAATRVDWADVAHLPSVERPDRFLALLRGWLANAR